LWHGTLGGDLRTKIRDPPPPYTPERPFTPYLILSKGHVTHMPLMENSICSMGYDFSFISTLKIANNKE